MSKPIFGVLVGLFICGLMVSGCAQQAKATDSQQAIAQAEQYQSIEEKVQYLVTQANQFLNSKEFNEAISTAQYVIKELDQNSQDAKNILETAKAELQKVAQGAVKDVKNVLGGIGQ